MKIILDSLLERKNSQFGSSHSNTLANEFFLILQNLSKAIQDLVAGRRICILIEQFVSRIGVILWRLCSSFPHNFILFLLLLFLLTESCKFASRTKVYTASILINLRIIELHAHTHLCCSSGWLALTRVMRAFI